MRTTDASRWTRLKDPVFPPGTRLDVIVQMLQNFVQEYYDQNPLSHLGFVYTKNGEAEILSALSCNSKTHTIALQSVAQMAASEGPLQGGEFSLQNGLEVAGRSLGHQPKHGSREIVVVTAALSTCDPGYLLTETLPKLQQAKIRVSCFALTAELYICRKLAEETGGTMGVCLDKPHFRDWMQGQCVPPPTLKDQMLACEMIQMGFPTRTSSDVAEIVHATREKTILARTAYTCPQCQAKNSDLPVACAVCSLKLVLAPHLARSFHHLFPVPPFVDCPVQNSLAQDERNVGSAPVVPSAPTSSVANDTMLELLNTKLLISSQDDDQCCFACLRPFGAGASEISPPQGKKPAAAEEFLRFQCPDCTNCFCLDCDAFLHETLHNCPGCLRK
jgi:transcription initiation factor TFIIH subunit 2